MGGKKKGGKKKGKKGGLDVFNDPEEFRAFNVAQRQTIATLMEKMNKLKEENTELREGVKESMENQT